MAYQQQHHDPYYNGAQNSPQQHGNTGAAVNYPYQYQDQNAAPYDHNAHVAPYPPNEYDAPSNWDGKSTKSFQSSAYGHGGSQVHLNPYEMSQVSIGQTIPPVPTMAYQPDYPPQQQQFRPGMYREQSTGYSVAREKMMKRRYALRGRILDRVSS